MIANEKTISLLRENGIRWVMLTCSSRVRWRVISVHREKPKPAYTWHHPVAIDCTYETFRNRLVEIMSRENA